MSSEKAISGPSIAPAVSSERWTPNAVASCSRSLESEISASRGAVRMPFPVRSRKTIAPSAGETLRGQQAEPREGRDPVAERRDLLVSARPVGEEAAGDAHERRRALLETVDDAELERREPEGVDEVERQDRRDHLRGDVREEAHQAQEDDVPPDTEAAWPAAEPQEVAEVCYLIQAGPSSKLSVRVWERVGCEEPDAAETNRCPASSRAGRFGPALSKPASREHLSAVGSLTAL